MSRMRGQDGQEAPAGKPGAAQGHGSEREPTYVWRTRRIVAILGVCTAALTLVSAALGVVSVRVNQERDQAVDRATSLSTEVSTLSEELTALEAERQSLDSEIGRLQQERDRLRQELDAASGDGVTPLGPFADEVTYLSDEVPLDQETFDSGTAQVGGEVYLHSVMGSQGWCTDDVSQAWAEYNLGRDYDRFTATLGLSDENASGNHTVRFEVILDNEQIFEQTLTGGEVVPLDLTVAGGLRLRLQLTFLDCVGHRSDEAVWGDATLIPTPGTG